MLLTLALKIISDSREGFYAVSLLLEKCTVSQGSTLKDSIHTEVFVYVYVYSFAEHLVGIQC